MRTVMRPRYYCDHCGKGSGSPSAMRRHEPSCTAYPQRVCSMCAKLAEAGGPKPAPPRDELVRVMDEQGFAVMCQAANQCPLCILSALRTKNHKGDSETPPGVSGPEDGRQDWDYQKEKARWWRDWDIRARRLAQRN